MEIFTEDNEITMSLKDFLIMRDKATMCEELLNVLFDKCTLECGDNILFNSHNINDYLRYAAPDRYSREIKKLKELKAKKVKEGNTGSLPRQ